MIYKTYKKKHYNVFQYIGMTMLALACILLLFLSGLMFYCNTFLEYHPVDGVSMQPLLNPSGKNEDYVYITRQTNNITYGDVIISLKSNGNYLVIKRVIAMGGDNIMIKPTGEFLEGTNDPEYAFFIQYNSQGEWIELDEPYIKDKSVYTYFVKADFEDYSVNKNFLKTENGELYLHIGDDEIFYAGDNRTNSEDCIDNGPQKLENVIGKVVYIIHGNESRLWQLIKQFLGISEWK